jgi:hypothetical protein
MKPARGHFVEYLAMRYVSQSGWVVLVLLGCAPSSGAENLGVGSASSVVELFEDEAGYLIRRLNDGPGAATREPKDKHSGVCSVRVTPLQRYSPKVFGWSFSIVEKPKPGEYRYIRFAWKKIGGNGIEIQLHDPMNGWHRYLAGSSPHTAPVVQIAEKPPDQWEVVTRDLFKDFGSFTIAGIALTPLDGDAGLFDHIYLGRTLEDLNKVDSAKVGQAAPKRGLSRRQLDELWEALASPDASLHAPAWWALVGGAADSVPFFRQRLQAQSLAPKEERQIARLLAELDDDKFMVRENATRQLARLGERAVPMLQECHDTTSSLEVRARIEQILRKRAPQETALTPDQRRTLRVIHILEQIGTEEARRVLEIVSRQAAEGELREEAVEALRRMRAPAAVKR